MSMESRCTIGAMASKKASAASPVSAADGVGEAGEVSGPVAMMTLSHSAGGSAATLAALDRDQRMTVQRRGDGVREAVAIDRERAAGRHLIGVGRAHDQRAEAAHFLVQQADGVVFGVVGAERVRADEFREAVGLVRFGLARRAHFVQHHGDAAAGDLPGGFGTGEAAADHMNGSAV